MLVSYTLLLLGEELGGSEQPAERMLPKQKLSIVVHVPMSSSLLAVNRQLAESPLKDGFGMVAQDASIHLLLAETNRIVSTHRCKCDFKEPLLADVALDLSRDWFETEPLLAKREPVAVAALSKALFRLDSQIFGLQA